MNPKYLPKTVCRRSRLLVLGIICCVLWLWGMVLLAEDYGVFNRLDVDADPVYSPNNGHRSPLKQNAINKTTVKRFPVLPIVGRAGMSTVAPLVENEVIPNGRNFIVRLAKSLTAFKREYLIVSLVDYGFVDMGLNFIRSAIENLKLRDVLFVICLDVESVKELERHGYWCLLLDLSDVGSPGAADFGSEEYYRKTNVKTWVVLQFLKLGRTILLSDVDVVLFKNPFPYFNCSSCDLHIQMDRELHNSGFVYVRSTDACISLYDKAWRFYLQYHTGHDQAYLNMAIRMMARNKSIAVEALSARRFPCGVYYFENDYRHFYNEPPCHECVMTHNNYMGTTSGKIYRFKENLLWLVDKDGYYSNTATKYLTYENPYDFGKATLELEREALLNAFIVAELTDRILILPSFRCCNCRTKSCDHPKTRCSLLSLFVVKTFDTVFSGRYREHSFLRNSLVPEKTKTGISPLVLFNTTVPDHVDISQYLDDEPSVKASLSLHFQQLTLAQADIRRVLNKYSSYPVIRLHSLYGSFQFDNITDGEGVNLLDKFRSGMQCGYYEQWEISMEEKVFGNFS